MLLNERGALSIKEAANYLSLGRTSVYGMIRTGELITVKRGRRTLVLSASIQAWLNANANAQVQQ